MAWNFTSQCLFSCGAGNRPATGHDLYPFSETPSLFFILLNSFPLDRRCRVHFHLEEAFSSIQRYAAGVTKARTLFSVFISASKSTNTPVAAILCFLAQIQLHSKYRNAGCCSVLDVTLLSCFSSLSTDVATAIVSFF